MQMAEDNSPIRDVHQDNDRLHGAVVLFNEGKGYERFRKLIVSCAAIEGEEYEPPTTFSEEEILP